MEIQTILNQLKIKAELVQFQNNGTISKYYLKLGPGIKVSKLESCATEIALGLKSYSKPIIRVITEQGLVVLELLTNPLKKVSFSELVSLNAFNLPIPLVLGKTHDGSSLVADLSVMPHLLIAGTTGSGKSVLLHSILNGIMETDRIKLALIDPKRVEFSYYSGVKQLMYPVITETLDGVDILSDLVNEMENRFILMSKHSVNNISDYNVKHSNKLDYIVLVIDEFSDLMYYHKKEFQKELCALAQKSRACGIHIIMATQRPSVDVITGLIKANFPARISCLVSSNIDSRIILNCGGAEKLLGKGDALINSIGYDMVRFQGAYLSVDEIKERCGKYERGVKQKIFNFLRGM